MTLDRKLSGSLRENAARVASQLMERETVREAVRRRLLGVPLPEVADLEGAPHEGVVADLIQEAAENRELVAIVGKAWDRVFWEHFSYSELQRLKQASVGSGGFAAVVCALNAGDESCFQHWMRGLSGSLSEQSLRSLLASWWATASELYEFDSRISTCRAPHSQSPSRRRSRS